MTRNLLRAVEVGEVAEKPITSVLEASEQGTRIDELVQIRRVIARALDNENTSPRDLASLSRRQIEISREIDMLRRQQAEEVDDAASIPDRPFDKAAI